MASWKSSVWSYGGRQRSGLVVRSTWRILSFLSWPGAFLALTFDCRHPYVSALSHIFAPPSVRCCDVSFRRMFTVDDRVVCTRNVLMAVHISVSSFQRLLCTMLHQLLCRDGASTEDKTRNNAMRRVVAAIHICQRRRPESFPHKNPLALQDHCHQYKNLLSQLGTPRGDKEMSLRKGPADTAAQASAFRYYVHCSIILS
jgi:hypothetical protein